ncbi:hypothetical protein IV203_032855 [Nitzschia inconspicua]|uniref:Uncharacterized protein n=1 Tax=Nitzschia inconspicua TaxID=303405 RepID=A0A9K3KLH4_9STRA|nr:hypothetical protein IV203_032855 [Nitzschia inconspicua]
MSTDTSVRISRMVSSSFNRDLIGDEMETAIFHGNSSIVIDYEHQKEEELAFCNRMAGILNRSTDLPMVCRNKFPSVVEALDHKAAEVEEIVAHHHPMHHQSSFPPKINATSVAAGYTSSFYTLYPMPPTSDR